jgi:F-type H+-transporting ATPase subunit alpha
MKQTAGVISLIEKALTPNAQTAIEEIGTVIGVGDGICKVYGLTNVIYGELVLFESGARGIVMDLDEDYVSIILLDHAADVFEQEVVRRTGHLFQVPVGDTLLGRVLSPSGDPIDAMGDIVPAEMRSIERTAPGIITRTPVCQPLETGCLVIDALIPIGKGQRELLIGNRSTGKTTTALNTIINQKGKNVICIYVVIGHKQSDTAKMVHLLQQYDALSYTIIVDASAKATALEQFLSPYVGCTMGEYFMDAGKDVLIIYDDLSNHAIAYRELSLLLRRPPGREAYPGDIFYIHSRLLERAGKMHPDHGGGSMTALPVIQTQGDDITAYIATNLISITDGQVFFDTNMFNNGIRPAISIGLSVSRVGGAAQTKSMKKISGSLKLELAQFEALAAFMQFGSELDATSQRAIDRGQRAVQLLKQDLHATYSQAEEIIFLFLLQENFFDRLDMSQINMFARQFVSYLLEIYPQVFHAVELSDGLTEPVESAIKRAAEEFILVFSKPKEGA